MLERRVTLHKGTQVDGQIGLSDLFKKELSITPQFQKGQPVFFRSLDVVLEGTVELSWLCDFNDELSYFGYVAPLTQGFHRTFWDTDIGNTVFFNKQSAEKAAREAEKSIEKIYPSVSDMTEIISFEYTRNFDGHKLTACLAKVGEKRIYEHEFYCYHFLRSYPSQKERDKAFQKAAQQLVNNAKMNGAQKVTPEFEMLYRVDESTYASREYAENHASLMRT